MGSIPAWGAVGSGGQVLPRVHSAQVGHLPGLSVWSLHVDKGFSPLTTPTEKTCKITEHMSIPLQAAHCSWGALEEGRSRMGKKQKINSDRPQACVCVCVCVCVLCVCVCVLHM